MSKFFNIVNSFFPFAKDLKNYNRVYFKSDLLAAVSVAIVASPQSMAYAVIAGVSPIYGLYASIIPVILAALFGSSNYLLAGPTNAISIILFSSMAQLSIAGVAISTLPEELKLPYIFAISLLAGIFQLFMGLARFGTLANFISHSVIMSFAAGGAIIVAVGQLKSLFGLEYSQPSNVLQMLASLFEHINDFNPWALILGLFTIACIFGLKKINQKMPAALLALVISSILAYLLNLEAKGVQMVGDIPKALIALSLPTSIGFAELSALFLSALSIALLGSVESIAIARTLASENSQKHDANQELIGQGIGNIAAGLFSGIPGCGSFGRSAVNYQSGAKTRFAAVFSGVLTLFALYFFGFLVSYIPLPTLAGLLIVLVLSMIKIDELKFIFKATKVDRYVLLATLFTAIIAGLEMAVIFGVLISLMLFVNKLTHPVIRPITRAMLRKRELDWALACQYITMFRLEGILFFGAVQKLEEKLYAYEVFNHKIVLLDISRVNWVDASSVHAIYGFIKRCEAKNIAVIICMPNDNIKAIFKRTGFEQKYQHSYLVASLEAGIHLALHILMEGTCPCCLKCSTGRRVLDESFSLDDDEHLECGPEFLAKSNST